MGLLQHPVRWLLALGSLSAICGVWGYLESGFGVLDAAYNTILLFTLNFERPNTGGIPIPMEIARFLAPTVTAGAAAAALMAVLRDETDELRARRSRGHVLICGAGERGLQLARGFAGRGERVVLVESDADRVRSVRSEGVRAPIVVGDARTAPVLKRAGAARAAKVFCVTGSDDDNAAIVSALSDVQAERDQFVLSHVSSPVLDRQFTARTLISGGKNRKIEWFNLERAVAIFLLSEYLAPREYFSKVTGELPDPGGIAIIGLSDAGRALLFEAARQWAALRKFVARGSNKRLPAMIVGEDCHAWLADARSMFEGLDTALDIRAFDERPLVSTWDPSSCDVTFVAIDDPIEALETALHLDAQRSGAANIVVRVLVDASAVTQALELDGRDDEALHIVNVIEKTCTPELLEHTLIERLARENHLRYEQRIPGQPASRQWEELDEMDRRSNREAAEHHVLVKIPAVGARLESLAGLPADDAAGFEFTPEEVERLAELEHERWMEEKKALGFQYAPIRKQDRENKLHPDLKPWAELSEHVREKDRMFVRELPAMLISCGYRIVPNQPRAEGRATQPASPLNVLGRWICDQLN